MTDEEFRRVTVFLKDRYGIDMSRKKEIVSGRLDNYLHNMGFRSYHEYMNAVQTDISGRLEHELVDILSTNHTFFMRENEHFAYLSKVVVPYLKKKEEAKKDLYIWCGASSTGEEPYTIAMTLLDCFGIEARVWDTTVLATDISMAALSTAAAGIYTGSQMAPVPDRWKSRYFKYRPDSDTYEATGELKERVLFRQFNLMNLFPFRHRMHVIFLRNVMIYFSKEDKNELLKKVYEALEPGGYLFIGRTETLDRDVVPFELVEPSIYRKPEK